MVFVETVQFFNLLLDFVTRFWFLLVLSQFKENKWNLPSIMH